MRECVQYTHDAARSNHHFDAHKIYASYTRKNKAEKREFVRDTLLVRAYYVASTAGNFSIAVTWHS